MINCLLIYLICGSHPFFALILEFVPFFLLFRPCLIILFGDRSLLLVCGFLSRILFLSKNVVILSVVPLRGGGGGGGGGFRPIILETLIMRYGLKGKGRTRPDFFRVVLGPNTKILTKRDSALIWTPFNFSRENKQFQIKKVKIG